LLDCWMGRRMECAGRTATWIFQDTDFSFFPITILALRRVYASSTMMFYDCLSSFTIPLYSCPVVGGEYWQAFVFFHHFAFSSCNWLGASEYSVFCIFSFVIGF